MTKKRIADLLKEEVEKPAEDNADSKSESKTESKSAGATSSATGRTRKRSSAKSTTAKSTSSEKTAAKKATAAKATTAKSTNKSADTNGKQSVTDAALTKQIAGLESTLTKSNDQIAALQEDVDTHQARIFELKDALEKAEEKANAATKEAERAAKEKDAEIE
ncbi:MAG: hypothetical protein AAFZ17_22610, partial [Cyanobacteria bacterium J06650_10]